MTLEAVISNNNSLKFAMGLSNYLILILILIQFINMLKKKEREKERVRECEKERYMFNKKYSSRNVCKIVFVQEN